MGWCQGVCELVEITLRFQHLDRLEHQFPVPQLRDAHGQHLTSAQPQQLSPDQAAIQGELTVL
jgi:hypothetical protein